MKNKLFYTKIRAIDPLDGQLKVWSGPQIKAGSIKEARKICKESLGFCEIDGQAG